jgi:hypothetical protein
MTIAGWAAAALFAIAVGLAIRPSARGRLRNRESFRVPTWARGHPDGPTLRQRLVLGLAVGTLVAVGLGVPVLVIPLVAVAVGLPVAVLLGKLEPPGVRRRTEAILRDLPQVCDLLAACLDAGLPLREATRVVAEAVGGPLGEELDRVTAQTSLGVPDAEAWRSLTQPGLVRLGRDLGRAAEAGTFSSRNLRLHAGDAALQSRALREEAARRVGIQSVLPLMSCFLPAFLLLGIVPIVGGFVGVLLG